jgi:hypothetical protein
MVQGHPGARLPGPEASKRALVEMILRRAAEFSWTVATGRLTTMVQRDLVCINVFHERFEQPYTRIHSHSLDFHSEIIAGELVHTRYRRDESGVEHGFQQLTLDSRPLASGVCGLTAGAEERYRPGDSYEITAPEIHRADALDGTVTLVTRQFRTSPEDVWAFWELPLGASKEVVPFGTVADRVLVEEVIGLALRRF